MSQRELECRDQVRAVSAILWSDACEPARHRSAMHGVRRRTAGVHATTESRHRYRPV